MGGALGSLVVAARLANPGIDRTSVAVLPFLLTYMLVIVIISLSPDIVTIQPDAFRG